MSERTFSEVSTTYNANLNQLNDARQIFEKEVRSLNEFVHAHLSERRQAEQRIEKLRWEAAEDWSTGREGPWLNWYCGTRIRLDVKLPGKTRFRKGAAFVYFQTIFDHDLDRFMFRCRLENQNTIAEDIDEQAFGIVQKRGENEFPGAHHVKANTAILFRYPLQDSLFDELNRNVDRALGAVEQAIEIILPDDRYVGAAVNGVDTPPSL